MKKHHQILTTFLSAVGLLSFPALSQGSLLLYDGLDYTADADLTGNNGGSGTVGWSAAWTELGGSDGSTEVTSPGLSYGSLVVEGNATEDNLDGGNSLGNSRAFNAIDTSGTKSFWFSSLVVPVSDRSYNGWFTDHSKLNDSEGFGWRLDYDTSTTGELFPYLSSEGTGASISFAEDEVLLIVGRIDLSDTAASDNLRLWVNPTIGGSAPADGSATASFLGGDFVDGGDFFSVGANNNGLGRYDEFRLGDSFSDVTPVPEPSAFTLILGISGLLFILHRGRGKL